MKHFSNIVDQGAEILGYDYSDAEKTCVLAVRNPDGKYAVIAGNFSDESRPVTVEVNGKYLNADLPPHSFNSYEVNK